MCFKREKCEIPCGQGGAGRVGKGSLHPWGLHGGAPHLLPHPPADTLQSHSGAKTHVSGNRLTKCENLLFDFTFLKGKQPGFAHFHGGGGLP